MSSVRRFNMARAVAIAAAFSLPGIQFISLYQTAIMNINPCAPFSYCAMLLLAACMKCDPYTRSCNLTTGNTVITQNSTVIYKVFSIGSVYINTLSYQDLKGRITVEKPLLPFSTTITATAGTQVGITVNGIAMEGSIFIEQAVTAGDDTTFTKDRCGD